MSGLGILALCIFVAFAAFCVGVIVGGVDPDL